MWFAKSLKFVLMWFPVLALVMICALTLVRRSYRELPYFSIYVFYALVIGGLRYAVYYLSPALYAYVFITTELVGVIIVSLAVYEVFLRRLFSQFYKVRFYRGLFTVVALILLVLTVLTALQAPDKGKAFLMASRAYDFVRTGVLVFMVALMALMGRHWTRYDLGIALGFAVQAATALLNAGIRTRLHYQPTTLDLVEAVSFDLSCLIWLVTFWRPEERTKLLPVEQLDPEMLNQARSWETVLKDWLTPGKKVKEIR